MGKQSGSDCPPKRVLDHEKHLREVDFREGVALNVGLAVVVLSCALPLWMVYLCVDAIAGKTTTFKMKIGVTLTIAIGGSAVTAGVAWIKNRKQRRELTRLRQRVASLEKQLLDRGGPGND
jgi:ABC-type nickel/cobalt efflux system permease component RcnA